MRKIIDKNGRLFGKVSVIDIFVAIVLIALCAAVYMRFFVKSETSLSSGEEFTYQLRVTNIKSTTADAMRPGDALYSDETGAKLGVIRSVETEPAMRETATVDGSYVVAPIENKVDATITVDATGIVSDGRYYADRTFEINVNEAVDIVTKYCICTATVWSIGE